MKGAGQTGETRAAPVVSGENRPAGGNEDRVLKGFGGHIASFLHATNTDVVSLDQRNGMNLGEASR